MLSIAMFLSFISFFFNWQQDQSVLSAFSDRTIEAANLLNKFGAAVSHYLIFKGFGISAFILALLIGLTGLYLFF